MGKAGNRHNPLHGLISPFLCHRVRTSLFLSSSPPLLPSLLPPSLSLKVLFLIDIIWLGFFFFFRKCFDEYELFWREFNNYTLLQIRAFIRMMLHISNFSYICHSFILLQAFLFIPMAIFQIRTVNIFLAFLSLKTNLMIFQKWRLCIQLSVLKVLTADLNQWISTFSHPYSLSDMFSASVTEP